MLIFVCGSVIHGTLFIHAGEEGILTAAGTDVTRYLESLAANLYQEIILDEEIVQKPTVSKPKRVNGVDYRIAAFIDRLKNRPNFIEWSDIVESPSYRRGSIKGDNSAAAMFIRTLENKPNFFDFAVNRDESIYENRIRGSLKPRD